MNGQQIGISEHFEFETVVSIERAKASDYWYGSPAVENMWDGMWGLFRGFGWQSGEDGSVMPAKIPGLARLPDSAAPIPPLPSGDAARLSCPSDPGIMHRRFYVTAWQAKQFKGLIYNSRVSFDITDPNAIVFFQIPESIAIAPGQSEAQWNDGEKILDYLTTKYVSEKAPIEPVVLRANAGDCVHVEFMNYLPKTLETMEGKHVTPNHQSYNLLPPIVNGFNFNQIQMSSRIGLVPQLVAENLANSHGSNIGINPCSTAGNMRQIE